MREMEVQVTPRVNGRTQTVKVDRRLLVIEMIRETLDLKASHIGCLTGDCGACTILLNGEIAKSCLCLAVAVDGCEIRTLEGAEDAITIALQAAFVKHHAFQCGFCTAGMIMVAADLLRRVLLPTEAEIRHAINGNLCRCTGYEPIVNAITAVARREHEPQ